MVLAAFTPLSLDKLSEADATQLAKLGFKLPDLAGVRTKVVALGPSAGQASTGAVSSGSSTAVGAQHPGPRDLSALVPRRMQANLFPRFAGSPGRRAS